MYVLVVAISGGDVVATSVVAKSAPSSNAVAFKYLCGSVHGHRQQEGGRGRMSDQQRWDQLPLFLPLPLPHLSPVLHHHGDCEKKYGGSQVMSR